MDINSPCCGTGLMFHYEDEGTFGSSYRVVSEIECDACYCSWNPNGISQFICTSPRCGKKNR